MQLKNGEIYGMRPHLDELKKTDVPARVGYHLGRLIKKLTTASDEIEIPRNNLGIKYGESLGNGTWQIKKDSPNRPQFDKEYTDLMNEVTDIEAKKVILPPDTKISVELLMVFEPFLEIADV